MFENITLISMDKFNINEIEYNRIEDTHESKNHNETIEEIKNQWNNVQKMLYMLANKNEALEEEMIELKENNEELKKEMIKLKENNKKLEKEMIELKENNEKLDDQNTKLNKKFNDITTDHIIYNKRVLEIEKGLDKTNNTIKYIINTHKSITKEIDKKISSLINK